MSSKTMSLLNNLKASTSALEDMSTENEPTTRQSAVRRTSRFVSYEALNYSRIYFKTKLSKIIQFLYLPLPKILSLEELQARKACIRTYVVFLKL